MTEDPHPTVTASQQLAAEVIALIDAIEARIASLEHPHPKTRGRVRGQRTVSRDFLISMVGAAETEPGLQHLSFDLDEVRDALQFEDAFRPVVILLRTLMSAVIFTIESKKARATAAALRTYAIARRMTRGDAHSPLAIYLAIVGEHLGHGRPRKRRPADSEDAPALPPSE